MTRHRPSPRRRMNRLRNLMIHACDLSQPVRYFLDHLARDPVFLEQSVPGKLELDDVLQAIGRYVLGLDGELGGQRFFRHGELWHGGCSFGVRPAKVVYHDGIDIGLVDIPLQDQHATVRFTRVLLMDLTGVEPPAP